ncbi:MAG: VWA domain-containing protein, partial [Mycobacteriaceae bacterium]
PEEGELRPQLLDRFGLTVQVSAPREPRLRAEVVRRRLAYDADPAATAERFASEEDELAARIAAARELLARVVLDDPTLERIAGVCAAFDVDGLRADIVTARTAAAHAAWCGRTEVTVDDIRVAATLALPHRRRRNPFDAPGLDPEQLEDALNDSAPEPHPEPEREPEPEPDPTPQPPGGGGQDGGDDAGTPQGTSDGPEGPSDTGPAAEPDAPDAPHDPADGPGPAQTAVAPAAAPDDPRPLRRLEVPGVGEGTPGRRSRARTDTGHVIGAARPEGRLRSLHLHATLLAAAPHQHERGRRGPGLRLVRTDLRATEREGRESNLVLFVVDASGSMAARRRMGQVKGAVLSLLLDAYQRRDKVGMITFAGAGAELALPPTSSVEAAAARLSDLPTGGRTPLAEGLLLAHATLAREKLRDSSRRPLLVVVTDGRFTAGGSPDAAAALLRAGGTAALVLDCEAGRVRLGLAADLATTLGAVLLPLAELTGDGDAPDLAGTVRAVRSVA